MQFTAAGDQKCPAEAVATRLQDAEAKVLITADGTTRRGKLVPMKEAADGAAAMSPTVERVVVWSRLGRSDVPWRDESGRAMPCRWRLSDGGVRASALRVRRPILPGRRADRASRRSLRSFQPHQSAVFDRSVSDRREVIYH